MESMLANKLTIIIVFDISQSHQFGVKYHPDLTPMKAHTIFLIDN